MSTIATLKTILADLESIESLRGEHREICAALPEGPGVLPERVRRYVTQYRAMSVELSKRTEQLENLMNRVQALDDARKLKAGEDVLSSPPLVRAWDKARAIVREVESEYAFGRHQVNLQPKVRDALVKAIGLALFEAVTRGT